MNNFDSIYLSRSVGLKSLSVRITNKKHKTDKFMNLLGGVGWRCKSTEAEQYSN